MNTSNYTTVRKDICNKNNQVHCIDMTSYQDHYSQQFRRKTATVITYSVVVMYPCCTKRFFWKNMKQVWIENLYYKMPSQISCLKFPNK